MPDKKVLHGSSILCRSASLLRLKTKQFKAWQIDGTGIGGRPNGRHR